VHEFKEDKKIFASLWQGKCTIAPSLSLKQHLVNYYGLDDADIFVVNNGINSEYAPVYDQVKKTHPTIAFIGSLSELKGIPYLLESFVGVNKIYGETELWIIGEGECQADIDRFIDNYDLGSSVKMLGWQTNIDPLLSVVDVLVIPSIQDNFPTVALEAMRLEIPVIATNVGGLPEIIDENINGLLVPPGDQLALTNAILALLSDEKKRKQMGKEARKKFLNEFTSVKMTEGILSVYQKAIKDN
jgi:glycosyltransferase involved in cell wall biosynthesis